MLPVAVPETSATRSTPFNGTLPEEGLAVRVTDKVGVGVGVTVGVGVGVGVPDFVKTIVLKDEVLPIL